MPRKDLIEVRGGTATEWASENPILDANEPGWDSTNNQFRVGNGTDHWADLPPSPSTADVEVLEARLAALEPGDWTALTLDTGWTHDADYGGVPQARLDTADTVRLSGVLMAGPTSTVSVTSAPLPAELRPSEPRELSCAVLIESDGPQTQGGDAIFIGTDGLVTVTVANTGSSQDANRYTLDGLTYTL